MIRLLIGGSPCTHWSIAQTKNRETTAEGVGWELFKNFLIALEKYQPDYFLYENNKSMSQAIREQITKEFGVEPVLINSALVSAQNRQRLYWVGKRNEDGSYSKVDVEQPEDRGIMLRDILEGGACRREKAYFMAEPIKPLTEAEMDYMVRETKDGRNHFAFEYFHDAGQDKSACITANIHKGVPYNVCAEPIRSGGVGAKTGLYATPVMRVPEATQKGLDYPIYQVKDGFITIKGKQYPIKLRDGCYIIRKLTVTECKRLQTVPEEYIFPVSDTQAYKMLGNGWTCDVIAHILGYMPGITTEPLEVFSMYDGMACGHIALDKRGGHIVRYYATEIDKYAIKTATHNFPDIIQLGDAYQVRADDWELAKRRESNE